MGFLCSWTCLLLISFQVPSLYRLLTHQFSLRPSETFWFRWQTCLLPQVFWSCCVLCPEDFHLSSNPCCSFWFFLLSPLSHFLRKALPSPSDLVKSPSYRFSEYRYLRWGSLKAESEAGMWGLVILEGRKEARRRRSCHTGRWHGALASAWSTEELCRADWTAESIVSLGRRGRGLLYSLLLYDNDWLWASGWVNIQAIPSRDIDRRYSWEGCMLRL